MTVVDDVAALLSRWSPDAVCDDCIASQLGLSVRQHANQKTRQLATRPGYARDLGRCVKCGVGRKVIRYGQATP